MSRFGRESYSFRGMNDQTENFDLKQKNWSRMIRSSHLSHLN